MKRSIRQYVDAIKKVIKKILKKIIIIKYPGDGKLRLYFAFPFKVDARIIFGLRHARKKIRPNKIVFDNYMGKGYGCNPKYVAEKLLEKYPGKFDIVWIVSKGDSARSEIPEWIRKVDYASQKALYEYATAKVWVSNYHKISFLKRGLFKKKGQYFIQMWHGSLGIKKIENDATCLTVDKKWLKLAKRSSRMVDFWISDSDFENAVYQQAFWNVKDILMYGHPRNDILFGDTNVAEEKVKSYFEIEGKKILLYAPTFREDYRLSCYQIDFETLREVLQNKFGGEWVILIRLHPRVRKYIKEILPPCPDIYDATYYTDIQELVASADCMITDYSSCIFDFMLTGRPGFVFAVDIEEFNTERGFYYPLEETPFPIARNNEELFQEIENFNETIYKESIDHFLREKGCMEDGHASERVANKIAELAKITMDDEARISQEKSGRSLLNLLYDRYHRYPMQRNKIVCDNFHGKGYGGDLKYIVQELLRRRDDLDIVWLINGVSEGFTFPMGVRTVPYNSEEAIYEIATAGVLIDNTMKFPGFKKRPDQYYIQTWHCAIPLKKMGLDNPVNCNNPKYLERVNENFPYVDLMVSSNKFSSEIFYRAFGYTGTILENGCPRNDFLIRTPQGLKDEIYERYNIAEEKRIVLCKFLKKESKIGPAELEGIQECLGDDFVIMACLRRKLQLEISDADNIINVSGQSDIHELMAVSDMMITDDPELIFDFMTTGRPAYLYAASIGAYRKKWNHYFGNDEMPFPIVSSVNELLQCLGNVNLDGYHTEVVRFMKEVGMNETGQATEGVLNFILKFIDSYKRDYKMDGSETNALV